MRAKQQFQVGTTIRHVHEWRAGDPCRLAQQVMGEDREIGYEWAQGTIDRIQDGYAWVRVPFGAHEYRVRVLLERLHPVSGAL